MELMTSLSPALHEYQRTGGRRGPRRDPGAELPRGARRNGAIKVERGDHEPRRVLASYPSATARLSPPRIARLATTTAIDGPIHGRNAPQPIVVDPPQRRTTRRVRFTRAGATRRRESRSRLIDKEPSR